MPSLFFNTQNQIKDFDVLENDNPVHTSAPLKGGLYVRAGHVSTI